ncbi:solute carrier family 22 member 7-like [Arapaima gigas]
MEQAENNFIAIVLSHHCNISSLENVGIFGTLTHKQQLSVSIPALEDGTLSFCEMFLQLQPQLHLLYGTSNTTVQCQHGWVHNSQHLLFHNSN